MEKGARADSKAPAKQAAEAVRAKHRNGGVGKEQTKGTPQRRAGDVEQAWQRAKLDPAVLPFPLPVHGKAGLKWAVLPTGEKVKWSDLGMDRRLEGRLKVWLAEGGGKVHKR